MPPRARGKQPPIADPAAPSDELIALRARVAELEAENARLEREAERLLGAVDELAATDALTGLANRRAFEATAERELYNAGRYGTLMALLVFDLGPEAGDETGAAAAGTTLAAFAATLRDCSRRGDVIARYGGPVFVHLMAQCGRSGAEAAVRRLLDLLGPRGRTCTAGIAVFPAHGTDLARLMEAAQGALREAAAAGESTFRVAG